MIYFKINLIKNREVLSAYRRWVYWVVLVYLLLCGAGLVLVCNRAAHQLMALLERRNKVEAAEHGLQAGGPIPHQITTVCADLEYTATTLERVKKLMEQRFFLVPVLLGVVRPLMPEAHLTRLDVDRKSGRLLFELVIPASQTSQAQHTGGLLAAWNGDPALLREVSDLRLSSTLHTVIAGRDFFVYKFEGALRRKG